MGGDFWKLCWEGNLEGVRLALQKEDVDVNSVDEEGRSGLMWAFINGARSPLKCNPFAILLLRHPGIDVSLRSKSGSTALFFAAKNRGEKYQHILTGDNQADPNLKDSKGNSALMIAVKTRDVVLVKLLLAHPDVDLDTRDHHRPSDSELERAQSSTTEILDELVLNEQSSLSALQPIWWSGLIKEKILVELVKYWAGRGRTLEEAARS